MGEQIEKNPCFYEIYILVGVDQEICLFALRDEVVELRFALTGVCLTTMLYSQLLTSLDE